MSHEENEIDLTEMSDFDEVVGDMSPEDEKFMAAVDSLSEIVCSEEFQNCVSDFCDQHCHEFENKEENKLSHYALFRTFGQMVEDIISAAFTPDRSPLTLEEFVQEVAKRPDELDGDVFEALFSMSDFQAFKEMMLTAKKTEVIEGDFGVITTNAL